jgi:putative hydrolase of the HAD superfamily
MRYSAVIFDFYGTVAEHDGGGLHLAELMRERGYDLPPELARRYWQEGLDGTEHDDHSQSREHYTAWQRSRLLELLAECGVPPAAALELAHRIEAPDAKGAMEAYPDAADVLGALRTRGVAVAICSNWDWDLRESVEQSGLHEHFEVIVSSAWVGARKPHPRIYEHTLSAIGARAERTLFVGDTWNCDVEGPLASGMTPVYVRREHREPDHTMPARPAPVHRFGELGPLLDLLE